MRGGGITSLLCFFFLGLGRGEMGEVVMEVRDRLLLGFWFLSRWIVENEEEEREETRGGGEKEELEVT